MLSEFNIEDILSSGNNLINRMGVTSPSVELTRVIDGEVDSSAVRVESEQSRPRVPNAVKELIAITARVDGASSAAKAFNVSDSLASSLKNGKASLPDESKAKVERQVERIRDDAMERMLMSIGVITDEKLSTVSPVAASQIAANMSRVVEKMMPRDTGNGVTNNIIFYAPRRREETDFEIIEAKVEEER
jgi:hypothetical protein